MKYLEIKQVQKGKCTVCQKKASKSVDGILYCSTCADTLLMVNIKRCITNLTHVIVKIAVIPISPTYEKQKKEALKGRV